MFVTIDCGSEWSIQVEQCNISFDRTRDIGSVLVHTQADLFLAYRDNLSYELRCDEHTIR